MHDVALGFEPLAILEVGAEISIEIGGGVSVLDPVSLGDELIDRATVYGHAVGVDVNVPAHALSVDVAAGEEMLDARGWLGPDTLTLDVEDLKPAAITRGRPLLSGLGLGRGSRRHSGHEQHEANPPEAGHRLS